METAMDGQDNTGGRPVLTTVAVVVLKVDAAGVRTRYASYLGASNWSLLLSPVQPSWIP
jgi:hypothetical protein